MSKQLIILVHGMGTHPKSNIIKEFKKGLGDRAEAFGKDPAGIIASVDYKEFNYSEYFDTIRKQFADNAQARRKGFSFLTGKGFEEKLLTQLTNFESKFGKDDFFYTHWLDVILYGTMYFGEKVRRDFISFFEKLRKKYNHKNIHIICHSLGTAVVHDAMAKYYRKNSDPFDNIPDLKTGNFNIATCWTVANVSRMVNLLNGLTDPNVSTFVTGNDGCMSDFYNVRHKYDPFTWFKRYDRLMDNGTTIEHEAFRKINTHDFYEYITEPYVSFMILGNIYGINVTKAEFKKGEKDYLEGSINQDVSEVKDLIDAVRKDASIDNIGTAMNKFKEIKNKLESL